MTEAALAESIKICGPGVPISQIGTVIQDIAEAHQLAVCEEFIGHGVGRVFHAAPQVRGVHGRARGGGGQLAGHEEWVRASGMAWAGWPARHHRRGTPRARQLAVCGAFIGQGA